MARPLRAEVEGGLYLIARGNNRQVIFHDDADFKKFLSLLSVQKAKLGFYLYAYCLMSNHFHLLIERQAVPIGRIMLRVLTGYSQYYNRKYRKVGHVFQGRHKAILCQADRYLGELVRYIHLNPVRAKMVRKAERYPWSSQRAYLGIEPAGIVDVDPVLRLFGARKAKARENFARFVAAVHGWAIRNSSIRRARVVSWGPKSLSTRPSTASGRPIVKAGVSERPGSLTPIA